MMVGKNNLFLTSMVLAVVVLAAFASENPICMENSKPCIRNTDCCEGCCFKERCVSYSENCIKENNPCSLHECPTNTVCYLQKVQCIQAPCPPIPACKPLDYDYN